MADIELKPGQYRDKSAAHQRATRRHLRISTIFGVWAALAWIAMVSFNLSPHPLATIAIAFGPGAIWYLWMAITDQ